MFGRRVRIDPAGIDKTDFYSYAHPVIVHLMRGAPVTALKRTNDNFAKVSRKAPNGHMDIGRVTLLRAVVFATGFPQNFAEAKGDATTAASIFEANGEKGNFDRAAAQHLIQWIERVEREGRRALANGQKDDPLAQDGSPLDQWIGDIGQNA